jgi:hypothetical protein
MPHSTFGNFNIYLVHHYVLIHQDVSTPLYKNPSTSCFDQRGGWGVGRWVSGVGFRV